MAYGLTTEGFLIKTLDIIRDEMGIALQQAFGPSIRLDDQSILGQLIGIVAERITMLWELAEAVNSGQDPDSATGSSLEQICLLTGTLRPQATHSSVLLTLTGDDATVVPALSRVNTDSTGIGFQTRADGTLALLDSWASATPYVVGDRVTSTSACFQCITAGTSSVTPANGPTGSPDYSGDPADTGLVAQAADDIHDGTVHWVYLGEGDSAVDVLATAIDTGVVAAVAGDLTAIVNSISGWESATNVDDATLGRNIATDSELRLLREQELAAGGSTPLNALIAELLATSGVLAASVFVNNTDTTDADGVPPHSVEALVRGPTPTTDAFDQSIWDALLAGVAAGIRTHGTVVGSATDAQQTVHVMKFSRPTPVPIYVRLDIIKDPDTYPEDGDEQVKAAVYTYGQAQVTGKDAVASRIAATAFTVEGVLDVTLCYIDDAPVPTTSTTVAISLRKLATYLTTNVAVNSTDGVP